MMQLFHWAAAALLLLCGWLTGSAFQARTEQHILQLQRTVELLQRWKAMQRQNCRKFRHRKDLMMRNAFALSSALPALAKAKRHRNANDWIITLPVLKHSCTRRSRKRHPGKAYRAGLALQPVRWQH